MLYSLDNDEIVYDYLVQRKYNHNPALKYRSGWNYSNIHKYHDESFKYLFEMFAENTCMWENRFRSKYFIILHAMDNYVLPVQTNHTLKNVVRDLETNYKDVSGLLVPIINAYTSRNITLVSEHTSKRIYYCDSTGYQVIFYSRMLATHPWATRDTYQARGFIGYRS